MKLKSLIAFAFVTLFFACKKQYNCSCSNGTSQTFSEKMVKKQADGSCKEIENSINEAYPQSCAGCGQIVTCSIK